MAKRKTGRKASKTRKTARKTAKRRKVYRIGAVPAKATRKASKRRKVYRIGATSPRKQPRKMSKGTSLMKTATDGVMTGAGQVAGLYLGAMAGRFIANPYLRAGAVLAAGVLVAKMAPNLRAVGVGMAGSGVTLAAAQLLPGLPAPSGGASARLGVGALTAAERKMIEQAAMGVNGTPQSEVLTGLYDTADVLA